MKNNGRAKCSVKSTEKALGFLNDNTDLNNPEQVKQFIANHNVTNGTKRNLCIAYSKFCNYYQMVWTPPIYKQEPKPRRIPTREKLQKLISSASENLSIKLQISLETGLRPIELCNLNVKDFDNEKRTIYPTTAKYGASRTLRTSNNLAQRLSGYITRNKLAQENKIFYGDSNYYGKQYRTHRNKLATKLKDSTLTIKTERKEKTNKRFRKNFEKRFLIPESVNRSKISAKYENGVLLITMPKKRPNIKKIVIK